MKKRWISIALALLMIMSLLPFGALAADTSLSDELAQNLAAVQGVDFSGADFSAGNDGAVALASGTGAFNYLKQKDINDGFSSNGTYMCVLQTSTSGNVTTSVLVAYTPEDDIIGLIENATNSTNSNYVHRVTLFIPSDLSMPYMAYQDSEIRGSSTDYARAWTSVNSSYTSEKIGRAHV